MDYIIVKNEPEIRHILAHILVAIYALADNCPLTAEDSIKSIEGLVTFNTDDPKESEKFYKEVNKMACIGRKGSMRRIKIRKRK